MKALGAALGRFVLVFCCDDTFDYQAMGRIFIGLCQVGAWGCFDEFNRLEENILSAVSQQVQQLQMGLRASTKEESAEIEIVGHRCRINLETSMQMNLKEVTNREGIFITMNPGYAGRSNLPDNLKKLFRSIAMTRPDNEQIAQVTFYAQGFEDAQHLAADIVPFFKLCREQLSSQPHYDFGLRALKSVLVSCGNLKRAKIQSSALPINTEKRWEAQLVLQSLHETISPKLLGNDITILKTIEEQVFPGLSYLPLDLNAISDSVKHFARAQYLVPTDAWLDKTLQLLQIQNIHHGIMMVGSAGSGKSSCWKTLLKALEAVDNVEMVSYVIDAKVMSKEQLYGKLDSTTREWTDGLFTGLLRKIVDNLRGEQTKHHWIVFDGDVDPEWVENLNRYLTC